jgi:hypothetical protein
MKRERGRFTKARQSQVAGVALALITAGGTATRLPAQNAPAAANKEKQTMTTQRKFYCNAKSLDQAERAQHKQLTDKLVTARIEIVEIDKGYEFQFLPSTVSLTELADWVAAESKCCPFFDFHIDLDREGTLLCLRLTGEEGIKAFIRSEFQVPAK